MAHEFRFWMTVMFYIHIIHCILPILAGIMTFIGHKGAIPGFIFAALVLVTIVIKLGCIVWGIVLFATEKGRVATGYMVLECMSEQNTVDCNPEGVF